MRERNGWRAIPAAAVGSCGFLFVAAFGIRAIPDSRLPAAAWVLAWAGAGVVSHWLAVEFRGQLWDVFPTPAAFVRREPDRFLMGY